MAKKSFFRNTPARAKLAGAAIVLFVALSMSACATYSTRGGVQTPLGAFTSPKINESRKPIAEYQVILGLITSGYDEFLAKTKGKDIDIINVSYLGLFQKFQAVAR